MRILVFGAGAIGSVLGGFLAKTGHDVTLLGRPWHLDAIRVPGLSIAGIWGEHRVRNMTLATRPEQAAGSPPYDWIFVCVKAYQTAAAAPIIAGLLGPSTLVCAFQNGLGNYETLAQAIDPGRIALGRIIFGAEISPGCVRVTVSPDDVIVGAPDARVPRERIEALVFALKGSGIPARSSEQILVELWAKVLYNCALNGLSTLLEVPYGTLLEQEPVRRLMAAIIEEAYRAAAAGRIPLKPATAEEYVAWLFTQLIPSTAAHHSSMLQDVLAGKPTEIEALNGAIVRLGREAGVPTPMNALVTRLVHEKERFTGVAV